MGAFKSYEIIVCCLITPPNSPRRERFEISLMGVMGCDGGARSKRASVLTLL